MPKFTGYVNYCLNWADNFFSVKIHVFRVKNFDMLKDKVFKKQAKNFSKIWCVKNWELQKTLNFNILKKCKLVKF